MQVTYGCMEALIQLTNSTRAGRPKQPLDSLHNLAAGRAQRGRIGFFPRLNAAAVIRRRAPGGVGGSAAALLLTFCKMLTIFEPPTRASPVANP